MKKALVKYALVLVTVVTIGAGPVKAQDVQWKCVFTCTSYSGYREAARALAKIRYACIFTKRGPVTITAAGKIVQSHNASDSQIRRGFAFSVFPVDLAKARRLLTGARLNNPKKGWIVH